MGRSGRHMNIMLVSVTEAYASDGHHCVRCASCRKAISVFGSEPWFAATPADRFALTDCKTQIAACGMEYAS